MALIRKRAWQLCDMNYYRVCVDIDTTVETLFGNQQGGRKGHNTKNRGKKGYRPVLGFIQQSREYLVGSLRKGETITGKETAGMIEKIRGYLPDCVQQVLIRADGEFQSWESVHACNQAKFDFIIANKRCNPAFDPGGWYQPKKRQPYPYNSCLYQPQGWHTPCRFVAMRIPIETTVTSDEGVQLALFEDDRYKYRIFYTTLRRKAHEVIREYDKRADVENLVGEAKREGLDAIPSSRFKSNYAYFQIVMLAYNIWRYMKILAATLLHKAVLSEGCLLDPPVLHADNGGPQKGFTMRAKLEDLGVTPSYSRPRVSNDNPYSESLFRTFKYRPEYPVKGFDSIDKARQWVRHFVGWYNEEHRHSAIRYVTPSQRHRGEDHTILANRHKVYQLAKQKRPDRWSAKSRNWEPVQQVWLNCPKDDETQVTGFSKVA